MSYPYLFIRPDQAGENMIKINAGDDLRHLAEVLRCKPGDKVFFSDSEKFKYRTRVAAINRSEALFDIEGKSTLVKSKPEKTLFQCVLKKNAMELVIQKATEIGIDSIVPVISERVVPDIKDNTSKLESRAQNCFISQCFKEGSNRSTCMVF